MLTDKEMDRLEELYEQAVVFYLDKTDFNPSDYLDEEEAEEYADLAERDDGTSIN